MSTVRTTALGQTVSAFFALCLAVCALMLSAPAHAQRPVNRTVTNVASVSANVGNAPLTFNTNPATFTIEARRTPSNIEFFRYAPNAPGTLVTRINGTDYNPNGTVPSEMSAPGPGVDPFRPIGPPRTSNGVILDLSGAVPLAPATSYLSGELMFVRVVDTGQNIDPETIETLVIIVRTSGGDEIVLRLYESGPDTGAFYAYVPSSRTSTPAHDPVLTAPALTRLTATYVDAFDATEVSVDTALVDPFGRVFDSLTGALLNDVEVTIVDAATGAPARVFGVDGVSRYPSTLRTGSVVTDASGLQYTLQPGEFLFPLMLPGDYRLLVSPPAGYFFPSGFAAADFQALPNAPFVIIDGSYGHLFRVLASGPLNFDVPLDGAGEIVLTKSALSETAAIGDTVGYTIDAENRDTLNAPVIIRDTLPVGMRYVQGSAQSGRGPINDVTVSENGRILTFRAGLLRPGDRLRISYAVTVSAGTAPGTAVNSAVGVNSVGAPTSNRTEAAVEIVEDLLRSRLTIIGRVAESACDGNQDWAKTLNDGSGVGGVRLYMETGEYVVTDENGLYHFEGVRPGTHNVQVDEKTLPKGYAPMVCEENSRYAQSPTSKFVDVQGGLIWRANFYLQRVSDVEVVAPHVDFDDTTEYQAYDIAWLEDADPTPRWVYPETGRTPSARSVNVGIVHPAHHSVELLLNGKPLPAGNYSGRDTTPAAAAELSRWRGIDILAGENVFVAQVKDQTGKIVRTLTESIWHVAEVQRARLVADQTTLVADGRTRPVVAIRLEDAAGRPVHKGRIITVDVSAPYRLASADAFEREQVVVAASVNTGSQIGADGVARIALEPTLQTGQVRIRVQLDNGRTEVITAWVTPEKRDWIVVGLAEGALSLTNFSERDEAMSKGRVAFFAKGMVKGDWLLTLAVDTAKRRGAADTGVFADYIDPNAYYTLYGDRTWQSTDAPSQFPVYVKLEKETTQLVFGDFETDLNDSVLARYARRLSGFKGVHHTDNASVSAFAADTNQGFVKDELAADGTSGPYRLSRNGLVRNGEQISVETRDRVRPDRVLAMRGFTRWVDYEIDYATGEIIFRHPVAAADAAFNPNVIVVDYEVARPAARSVTAGARAAVFTADRRVEAGASVIREDTGNGRKTDLVGVDAKAQLFENTQLRAEVATSARDTETGTERADAYLVEITRQSETLAVSGYFREEQAGFGLGQQGSSTNSIRRIGAEANVQLSNALSDDAAVRLGRFLEGRVYREENLDSKAVRDVAEASLRQDNGVTGGALGLRSVSEAYPGTDDTRESVLLTGALHHTFVDLGLTVTAAHEQPIFHTDDEATLFPQRSQLGIDKVVNDRVTLNLRHEVNNGADASGDNTTLGATVRPWTGAEARIVADRLTADSATRLGATLGLDQTFVLNDRWSASVGAARRARIDGGDDARDVTPDAAVSPLEDGLRSPLARDEAYTSAYAGFGFRAEKAAASTRLEYRSSDLGTRWTAALGAAREASEKLSYGAAARWQTETTSGALEHTRLEARLGSAWRPRGEGVVVLNRLDAFVDETAGEFETRKLVNNLGLNWMLSDQTQAAFAWGVKFQETDAGAAHTSGLTQLFVGELRHDISRRIDLGVSGSVLVDHATDTRDYAFGPSIGLTPAENVWVSLGYNFSGFVDADFEAAEYSENGIYMKLRVKFDQKTAEGFLQSLSPRR
jgi:uncharacterized repeat protein (TIGR01451 family)